jgi:hypothetical protein
LFVFALVKLGECGIDFVGRAVEVTSFGPLCDAFEHGVDELILIGAALAPGNGFKRNGDGVFDFFDGLIEIERFVGLKLERKLFDNWTFKTCMLRCGDRSARL